MTRVLVVGAGHNGLVAAGHLAAAGLEVTVLEHAPRLGGAASSVEVTLPGFVHDHCAGFAPVAAASPAIRELELEREGLEWVVPDVVMAHPFEDGSAFALHRDVGATAASLGPAGRAWEDVMRRWHPLGETLARSVLEPLHALGARTRLAAALRRDGLEWGRRLVGSAEALALDVFTGDRRAAAWLSGSAMHAALPPTAAISGGFGFMMQVLGHTHGWPYPRGGMQAFADALAAKARRAGAAVRCEAHVEEVLVRRGRVAGVRLAGGEELPADAVVTTVSAGVLARMLPEGALPGRLHRRLRVWRYATAAVKVDYALSAPVPWTAEAPRRASVVHVAGELEELEAALVQSNRGVMPDRPALIVGQHTLDDPTRAPAGQHTLYTYAHLPSAYDQSDEEVADRVDAQLERFAPGFRGTVLARSIRPPARSEEENPSLVGGDLGGGSYEIDQQLIWRPAPELCNYRAPLRGLYVGGASVHPGGAVHGISGRGAAHALLADRRLRPWRRP